MIFYEVEHCDGHFLVATQADAKRIAREMKCTWSQTDVPTDKAGLMDFINRLYGPRVTEVTMPGPEVSDNGIEYKLATPIVETDAIRYSIAIDDEWDKLPLARKLCFAASALEDARRQV